MCEIRKVRNARVKIFRHPPPPQLALAPPPLRLIHRSDTFEAPQNEIKIAGDSRNFFSTILVKSAVSSSVCLSV